MLTTHAQQTTKKETSAWVQRLARLGFVARGVTYLLLAWLSIEIAVGHPHRQASDTGAFELLASHVWGVIILVVMGFGFAGYAVWSLTCVLGQLRRLRPEPQTDVRVEAESKVKDAGYRLASLGRAVVYGFLCFLAFGLATGAGHGSSGDPSPIAARAMQHPAGQIVVALAGAVIIIAGLVLAWRALRLRFLDDMHTENLSPGTRRAVSTLGLVGSVARGLVVALVGVFLLVAGVDHRPRQAKGLDASLVTLAHQPYGPVLLIGVAAGLAVFGVFSMLEARYIQT